MRQQFWKRRAKILGVVLAATMGVSGFSTEVRAFTVNSGDLVLALYNNGTEYYQDLGSSATLLAPGSNTLFDLGQSTLTPMTAVSGSNPVSWTVVRATFGAALPPSSIFMNAGSLLNAQQTQDAADTGTNFSISQANSSIRSWINLLAPVSAPLGNQVLLLSNDQASFTTTMGLGGSLNGSFTGFGMEGSFGNTLTILQGVVAGNALSDAGRAILMADGKVSLCGGAGCTPAPVPIPAAAVLFATGVIGMIGIVRRKMGRGGIAG
jgi:hypothetical protein